MKREDLKRAIELNKEIEELERNRNFLEAVEKFKNIILEKFNNKIEELTKEFESL